MMGGAGLNTLNSWYIKKYALAEENRCGKFAGSPNAAAEHVNIFIGNHADQNMTQVLPLLTAGQHYIFVDPNM